MLKKVGESYLVLSLRIVVVQGKPRVLIDACFESMLPKMSLFRSPQEICYFLGSSLDHCLQLDKKRPAVVTRWNFDRLVILQETLTELCGSSPERKLLNDKQED